MYYVAKMLLDSCFIISFNQKERMSKTTILEVYKDKKGLYQFKLVSKTGATVFLSEKFEKKAQVMGTVKRLAEWVSKATLVDADKKADAASKTTAKQPVKKVAPKVEAKAATKKPASKKVA